MAKPDSFATRPPRITVLADHPVADITAAEDGMGFEKKLGAVYDVLRNKRTRAPMTIAIYGGWGTGKTSAMRWLSAQLREWNARSQKQRDGHPRAIPVWFDPWKYSSREDVWRGLIAEVILASLQFGETRFERVKQAVRRFGPYLGRSFVRAVSSLKIALKQGDTGFEIDLAEIQKIVDDYKATASPEKGYLNEFEDSLRSWVTSGLGDRDRMVVFIDDLDRCLPAVTLEVLEALKLYLNIPALMFVVGLDRSVVNAVVRRHYRKHGVDKEKADQYLDKLFQVEVDVAPSQAVVEDFQRNAIRALDEASGGVWSRRLDEAGSETRELVEKKVSRLCRDNPREVKRLLNSLLFRAMEADGSGKGSEDTILRFAQGAQVFLLSRFLERTVGAGAGALLLRQEVQTLFSDWSRLVRDYPGKRGVQVSDHGRADRRPGIAAFNDRLESLQAVRVPFRAESLELVTAPSDDLWDLLSIPFSVEVAGALSVTASARATGLTSYAAEGSSLPLWLKRPVARALDMRVEDVDATHLGTCRRLRLAGMEVLDLSPLVGLTALESLHIERTRVSDLSPLAGLTALKSLHIERTQVLDLSPLVGLTALESLHIERTRVSDLSPLAGLTALVALHIGRNEVSDVGPLSGLTALKTLLLEEREVADVSPLSGLTALTRLSLQDTRVSDVSPLSGLAALKTLELGGTPVSNVLPLSGLTALDYLGLHHSRVSDISPLSGLSALKTLELGETRVSDASPLSALTGLKQLYLYATQVSDVSPLSGLVALEELNMDSTDVSDLSPLAGLKALTHLDLDNTLVSELSPLSGLTALTTLFLQKTQVSDISPLSGLTALTALLLRSTAVTDLSPLSALTALETLILSDAPVSDVAPLVGLSRLTKLMLANTLVSDITPLSELTDLEWLELDRTQVRDLSPLSQLKVLKWLDLRGTQVSDVSPLSELVELKSLRLAGTLVTDASPLAELAMLTVDFVS